jgi:hypothetical protein
MPDERRPISITLSAAQVQDVLRAAARNDTPNHSALVARSPSRSRAAPPTAGPGGHPARGHSTEGHLEGRLSQSLVRGLSLLRCFAPDGAPRGIVELSAELEMTPSTAHRYAATLVELGLLERCPDTRKYRLPPA